MKDKSGSNYSGSSLFAGHDHFYDRARIDDGNGDADNDVRQLIVGSNFFRCYGWTLKKLWVTNRFHHRE